MLTFCGRRGAWWHRRCTLPTSHSLLHIHTHTLHSTLRTLHSTPYTLLFKLPTSHSTLYTLHDTPHPASPPHATVYNGLGTRVKKTGTRTCQLLPMSTTEMWKLMGKAGRMKDIVEDRLRERALYVCGQFSALLSQSVNLFHLALTLAIVSSRSFLGSFHRPIPVRCNWSVVASKMHSTSEFAKIVLSKCVRESCR